MDGDLAASHEAIAVAALELEHALGALRQAQAGTIEALPTSPVKQLEELEKRNRIDEAAEKAKADAALRVQLEEAILRAEKAAAEAAAKESHSLELKAQLLESQAESAKLQMAKEAAETDARNKAIFAEAARIETERAAALAAIAGEEARKSEAMVQSAQAQLRHEREERARAERETEQARASEEEARRFANVQHAKAIESAKSIPDNRGSQASTPNTAQTAPWSVTSQFEQNAQQTIDTAAAQVQRSTSDSRHIVQQSLPLVVPGGKPTWPDDSDHSVRSSSASRTIRVPTITPTPAPKVNSTQQSQPQRATTVRKSGAIQVLPGLPPVQYKYERTVKSSPVSTNPSSVRGYTAEQVRAVQRMEIEKHRAEQRAQIENDRRIRNAHK